MVEEKFLAKGTEYIVYKLNNGRVIKKPHSKLLGERVGDTQDVLGRATMQRAERDLRLLTLYIPSEFIPLTKIQTNNNHRWWMIQDFVDGKPDFKASKILEQLLHLMDKNTELIKYSGLQIDWLGMRPAVCLKNLLINSSWMAFSNLAVDEAGILKIVDTGLLWSGKTRPECNRISLERLETLPCFYFTQGVLRELKKRIHRKKI